MTNVSLYWILGQSNAEGLAGAGTFAGLGADITGPQTNVNVWNDKAGGLSTEAITDVQWGDKGKVFLVTTATPHTVDVISQQVVSVTIASNTGAGSASINGSFYAIAMDTVTLACVHTTARSGTPIVDGTITSGGGGAWEVLDNTTENHHSEPVAVGSTGFYGPELRLAKLLADNEGATASDPIYIYKFAHPGTGMTPQTSTLMQLGISTVLPQASGQNDWAVETGELYKEVFFRHFRAGNALTAVGDKAIHRGVFWIQGEADGSAAVAANRYKDFFAEFINNFRITTFTLRAANDIVSSLSIWPEPWVTAQISTVQSPGTAATLKTVRDAQYDVIGDVTDDLAALGFAGVDPVYKIFDTTGLTTSDGLHFDSTGVEALAQGLYAAFLSSTSAPDVRWTDFPTEAEVRARVERRYGRSNTNLTDVLLDEIVQDAAQEAVARLGDAATWNKKIISQSLTRDGDGFVTLPSSVKVPLDISVASQRRDVVWKVSGFADSGAVQIWLDPYIEAATQTYRIEYEVDWFVELADQDLIPVPERHCEIVVLLACRRLAEVDNSPERVTQFERASERRLQSVMADQNRLNRQRKPVFRVKRRRSPTGRRFLPYGTGG